MCLVLHKQDGDNFPFKFGRMGELQHVVQPRFHGAKRADFDKFQMRVSVLVVGSTVKHALYETGLQLAECGGAYSSGGCCSRLKARHFRYRSRESRYADLA